MVIRPARVCSFDMTMYIDLLKEPSPIFSTFFSNFWRFWYHKKAHSFLIIHRKISQLKVFCLEYIYENVPGLGNHN